MTRILRFGLFSLAAAALALAVPQTSHAQVRVQVGIGSGYSPYAGAPFASYPAYSPYQPSLGSSYGYGSYDRYRRYDQRQIIVHPETSHWTPRRGWHTHGHYHVPHRGHYHTHPY